MAMAVVSRFVSGIWRADFSSGAIPRNESRCCLCIASRGVHSFFPSYPQQQQGGTRCGMRRSMLSKLTFRTSTLVPSYQNCLQTTRSERQFLTGSNWNTLQLNRDLLADGDRGGGTKHLCTPVRGMASSKAKEQPRGSLWRTRSVISKETVQAVHDLKRNKDNSTELARVFQTRIPRLLKMDLLATLSELQRQNEIELALQIFDIVRKEIWYKPDQFLYRSMMDALGRNRRIPEVEKKFQELQDEGIKPEVPIYRELVGAYVRSHMLPEALAIHAKMVDNGCGDDRLALQFIETGKEKEAVRIKQRRKAAEKLKAEEAALAESSSEVPVLTSTEI